MEGGVGNESVLCPPRGYIQGTWVQGCPAVGVGVGGGVPSLVPRWSIPQAVQGPLCALELFSWLTGEWALS